MNWQPEHTHQILIFLAIFFIGEIVSTLVFVLLSKGFKSGIRNSISVKSIVKGMIERSFVFISLINQFPQALIVFGALKIATRLKDNESQITNDYFLVGNLISLTLCITYYLIWNLII